MSLKKQIEEKSLQLSELKTQTDNLHLDCQAATNYLARLTAEKDALDNLKGFNATQKM